MTAAFRKQAASGNGDSLEPNVFHGWALRGLSPRGELQGYWAFGASVKEMAVQRRPFPFNNEYSYGNGTLQAVPPDGSLTTGFILSEQKPRWPDVPTMRGTPVTV